jgi:predicted DNA-binding ribbon-helix-helix protein
MKSAVEKRSVVVGGHKTSISLEEAFWARLKEIARTKECTLSKLIADIDAGRLFVLDYVRSRGRQIQSPG